MHSTTGVLKNDAALVQKLLKDVAVFASWLSKLCQK